MIIIITEQNNKFYVCAKIVNKNICFITDTKDASTRKLDEIKLNEAFFLMYKIDDKKNR